MSGSEKVPALFSENIPGDPDPGSVKLTLQSRKYFGFDLDDTLHEFRKASASASSAVFDAIQQQTGMSIEPLESTYTEILRSKTASAFTEGRTSTEY